LAFGFLGAAWWLHDPVYDAWGSISIGVVLILVAVFIGVRIQSLLVGKSAEPELRRAIDEAIAGNGEVLEVLNTITLHFGANVMLAAKVRFINNISVDEAADLINDLEARLKHRFPQISWCFIEPDHLR
jgi:divalent metal cation (Fe/Co/Zn/Cd) transporter